MIKAFTDWARKNGWKIEEDNKPLPIQVLNRYKTLPKSWLTFIEGYGSIVNNEENIWFLTTSNYYPKSEKEWRYNEYELISIDATDGDDDWQTEIVEFWDNHIPIVKSVGNGYEYYAIELDSGNIVRGFEPEFEETEFVAESFDEFIHMVINDEIFEVI